MSWVHILSTKSDYFLHTRTNGRTNTRVLNHRTNVRSASRNNTRRARVAPKGLLCREVQLNSVPAQRQFAIIQIKLTFSPQAALVRNGPVFGPEGSALHAKRSKSWPKTGPRTDFVTSDARARTDRLTCFSRPLYTIAPSGQ